MTASWKATMKWHIGLGMVLSLALVIGLLYRVNVRQLVLTLQSAHYALVILAATVVLFSIVVRSWRWQYILQPVQSVHLISLVSATSIGFMVNMLLPAHAGEVARAYVVGQREQMTTMDSFASIVVERMVDFLSLFLFIIPVLVVASLSPDLGAVTRSLKTAALLIALLGIALVAILWCLTCKTLPTVARLEVCLRLLPHKWRRAAGSVLMSFAGSLQAFRRVRHLAPIVSLSLAIWCLQVLSNWLIFLAFGLRLPALAAFFVLFVQIVGVTVPSSPGFIGTYHASVIAGLGYFGLTPDVALSVALSMHAAFFFPCIAVGFVFLWTENLSLRQLRASVQQATAEQPHP